MAVEPRQQPSNDREFLDGLDAGPTHRLCGRLSDSDVGPTDGRHLSDRCWPESPVGEEMGGYL